MRTGFIAVALLGLGAVAHTDSREDGEILANHASCSLFEGSTRNQQAEAQSRRDRFARSEMTAEVVAKLGNKTLAVEATPPANATPAGTIDKYIFRAIDDARVKPAPRTTDAEFLRRVSLDLTGRIPKAERVVAFLNDPGADKRTRLVDELLASSAWVDKWTMYYGDLLKNTARTDQVQRYDDGRNAFHEWIKDSLARNKPYHQMARELISATGENSWKQGELNWVVGGFVTGGPQQDIYDQQLANTFETFMGVSHMNCLLCHSGAGHLTGLSLWGQQFKRSQAWALASHYSRTSLQRVRVSDTPLQYYWAADDLSPRLRTDYMLNTTTGNRPARCANGAIPAAGERCAATAAVAPQYLDGDKPQPGEGYRTALARKITGDPQFARAAVNYLWAEFFGRGLVEPVNQFDLARVDPDNPPPSPWTLQPSHPELLRDLAREFVQDGYDLKKLMRTMVLSDAYQLSSRYEGAWKASWEPLFARKLVRRLWAEEIHDAIAQSSNLIPAYTIRTYGTARWAMEFPEPRQMPDGGGRVAQFLDSFLRGNREGEERRGDGSVLQALNLMNDPFVLTRTRVAQTGGLTGREPSLLAAVLPLDNVGLVNQLYLSVLSRMPSRDEQQAAVQALVSGNRQQAAENLLWALYNKVDFIYNY